MTAGDMVTLSNMNQLYNHQLFAAIVIAFLIISTLAIVDAFSHRGGGGITTICKSTPHDVHKISLHHRPLFATTRRDNDESTTEQSKSLFDQIKMPWDSSDNNDSDDGVSKSQQWWPIKSDDKQQSKQSSSSIEQQTKQRRKPRVPPRYPSALQYDNSGTTISSQSSSNVDDDETTKDTLRDNNKNQHPSPKDIGSDEDRELSLFDTDEDINNNEPSTIDSSSSNRRIPAHYKIHKMESQLTKYKNRYILLEDALKSKVKELSIMTNRVTLLEDVLSKLQQSDDDNKSDVGIDDGSSMDSRDDSLKDSEEIANLTSTIERVNEEKAQLVSRIESMTLQQTEAEDEYKATVANLKAELTSLEQERDKLLVDIQKNREVEQQNATNSNSDEAKDDTIQQQQTKISELTSQLTNLLDAHTELEQLQNDTETSLQQLKQQIKVKHDEHEIALTNERQEKETYMKKWQDILGDLEEDAARMLVDQYNIIKPQQLLDENEKKYEAMLEKERSRVTKWRSKFETLSNDMSASNSSRNEEEWISLQKQLEEVTELNVNATAKVHELEIQLEKAQQNYTSTAQEVEQQQMLQDYLQAQLKTYYNTIEEQKNTISQYDEKISNLESSHEEGMLIATNSVEASQKREESLLTNIEELESELSIAKDITDKRDEEINTLQSRLDEMKDKRDSLISHDRNANKELADHNKELAMKVERLEYQVQEVTLDRDRLRLEKKKLQLDVMLDMNDDVDDVSRGGRDQAKHRPRRWYRPWTLLRRQRRE